MVKVFIGNSNVSDYISYSKCPQKLADTLASSHLAKSFTPLALDFCSKAVQIRCSASFNSGFFLGTAWCLVAIGSSKNEG